MLRIIYINIILYFLCFQGLLFSNEVLAPQSIDFGAKKTYAVLEVLNIIKLLMLTNQEVAEISANSILDQLSTDKDLKKRIKDLQTFSGCENLKPKILSDSGSYVLVLEFDEFPNLVFKVFKPSIDGSSYIPGTYNFEKEQMDKILDKFSYKKQVEQFSVNGFKLNFIPNSAGFLYKDGFIIQEETEELRYILDVPRQNMVQNIIDGYERLGISFKDARIANCGRRTVFFKKLLNKNTKSSKINSDFVNYDFSYLTLTPHAIKMHRINKFIRNSIHSIKNFFNISS